MGVGKVLFAGRAGSVGSVPTSTCVMRAIASFVPLVCTTLQVTILNRHNTTHRLTIHSHHNTISIRPPTHAGTHARSALTNTCTRTRSVQTHPPPRPQTLASGHTFNRMEPLPPRPTRPTPPGQTAMINNTPRRDGPSGLLRCACVCACVRACRKRYAIAES